MTAPDPSAPQIVVNPEDALADEPIAVQLSGFAPNQPVTVQARTLPENGQLAWTAQATFLADAAGTVDLATQAPTSGSYSGVDPTGLLWSLCPSAEAGGARGIGGGLNPIHLELTVEVDGNPVATARVLRRAVAPDVTVEAIRADGVVANLFLPPGDGPFPTIVVVGGSGGGFADGSAALFASHGYAALSLAYFGVAGLPSELLHIPLEYFENALAWVQRHPALDNDRLAVSGTSRGGELALLLAARYATLQAVVAYVPSGFLWGAVSRDEDDSPDAFASWTFGGESLPYVSRIRNDAVEPDPDGVHTYTPAFLRAIEDPERAASATIPVERINGPILLVSGRDDALWPSAVFSDLIVERLNQHAFPHSYRHLSYQGAGHTIGPRYAPTTITKGFHGVRQVTINFGGTPSAIAAARNDSWPQVLDFLEAFVRNRVPAAAAAAR